MNKFFRDFRLGLRMTFKSFDFVFKHKMGHFFIYPMIITVIIAIGAVQGIRALVDWVEGQIYTVLDLTPVELPQGWWDTVVYWMQNLAEGLITILLHVAFYFLLHKTIKYAVLILMSPVMALLSEKTEKVITGKDFPFHWGQFLRDIWRGVLIAMRNFFMETVMVLGVIVLGIILSSFVPFLAVIVAPLTLLLTAGISAYYWGFATMDYTNERRRLSLKESVEFIREYKGIAVGNGLVFYLMISVPFIGSYLGPVFATVLCTVGATLAIHEKVDLSNEDIVLHKTDNPTASIER
ncbi:MAG: CysZ protein [Flavobacteriales bacterium]|jgi:CysZ protein